MSAHLHEHKFLADFQPFNDRTADNTVRYKGLLLNWVALFATAYVVGAGLRLGLGL